MATLGERQAAEQFAEEQYNRDNYKRWPWGSFAFAAICSGIIFMLASSPSNMPTMEPPQQALSGIFIAVALLLFIPTAFGLIFYIFYCIIVKLIGWKCICQDFADRFIDKQEEKPPLSSGTAQPNSVYYTSDAPPPYRQGGAGPEYGRRGQPAYPPTYNEAMLDDRPDTRYPPDHKPRMDSQGNQDNRVIQVVVEYDRQRGDQSRGSDRYDFPNSQQQPSVTVHSSQRDYPSYGGTRIEDGRHQDTHGQGQLLRDKEGNMLLHI